MSKFSKKMTASEKESKASEEVDAKTGEVHRIPPFATKAGRKASKKEVVKDQKLQTAKPVKASKKTSAEDNRKITVVAKENPKREGSNSYKRFELYKENGTVSKFLAAGGTSADLRYDQKAGYIKVA